MRDRGRHRLREKQAPCGEPDVGLDPRTPGSLPEPKADAEPLSHPSALENTLNQIFPDAWVAQPSSICLWLRS